MSDPAPADAVTDAERDKRRKLARMFAEAVATDAHQPPAASGSQTVVPGGGDAKQDDGEDDSDDDLPAPKPPTKTANEDAELLHVNCDDQVIEINNLRLFTLTEVDLHKFTSCVQLELRKNLIHELSPSFPEALAANLVVLDLFDNKIRKIPAGFFAGFSKLEKLDLSYNQIKTIENLDALAPTLKDLYLVENRIKDVIGLNALTNLRLLELGGNRIRCVGDGLSTLVNLEELWLGKNKIADLGPAFTALRSLKRLSVQANRLTSVGEETFPPGANPSLEELYLSENGLTATQHIRHLSAMRLLDYSMNPIAAIDGAEINQAAMPQLAEFWLTDGKIEAWTEVNKLTVFSESLEVVYLERNPIEQDKRYRDKVFMELPFLKQIDSWPVINKENPEADRAIHRRQ